MYHLCLTFPCFSARSSVPRRIGVHHLDRHRSSQATPHGSSKLTNSARALVLKNSLQTASSEKRRYHTAVSQFHDLDGTSNTHNERSKCYQNDSFLQSSVLKTKFQQVNQRSETALKKGGIEWEIKNKLSLEVRSLHGDQPECLFQAFVRSTCEYESHRPHSMDFDESVLAAVSITLTLRS
jgi:hypothetical protein